MMRTRKVSRLVPSVHVARMTEVHHAIRTPPTQTMYPEKSPFVKRQNTPTPVTCPTLTEIINPSDERNVLESAHPDLDCIDEMGEEDNNSDPK